MQNLQGYGDGKKTTVTCMLESYVGVDKLHTIEVFDGNFAVGVVLMRTAGRLLVIGIKIPRLNWDRRVLAGSLIGDWTSFMSFWWRLLRTLGRHLLQHDPSHSCIFQLHVSFQ